MNTKIAVNNGTEDLTHNFNGYVNKSGRKSSKFWMPTFDTPHFGNDSALADKLSNTFKLAQYQKAISNFVHIMTNESSIRVRYSSKDSYTDGSTVTICAKLVQDKFDVTVGLALHEASHIVYSDMFAGHYIVNNFDIDKVLHSIRKVGKEYINYLHKNNVIPIADSQSASFISYIKKEMRRYEPDSRALTSEYYTKLGVTDASKLSNIMDIHIKTRKIIHNVIEDLYIDATSYRNAPGYRDYYLSLYNEYFGQESIGKGLNSDEFTKPTIDNYLFHITNMRNPNRNLTKLPYLDKIFKLMNLFKIHTVKSPAKRFFISDEIFKLVLKGIDKEAEWEEINNAIQSIKDEMEAQQKNISDMSDEELQQLAEEIAESIMNGTAKVSKNGKGIPINIPGIEDLFEDDADDDSSSESSSGGESEDDEETSDEKSSALDKLSKHIKDALTSDSLNSQEKKEIESEIKKQHKYIESDVEKTSIDESQQSQIDGICSVDVDSKVVGKTLTKQRNSKTGKLKDFKIGGINCNIIKNINEFFIQTAGQQYGFSEKSISGKLDSAIENGIRNGNILARKIQLRNEEKSLKTSRLKNGRIDPRLLHEIAVKNESVFHKVLVDKYEPTFIHISIDQSGSMSGQRWENSLEMAAMISAAAKKITNLHVIVTTRSCGPDGLPYIMEIFDSKKHGVHHIRKHFKRLNTTSSTPEGLCFEAILKETIKYSQNRVSYFINICDGEPYYGYNDSESDVSISYSGTDAYNHTRQMMNKMEAAGIKFMAYFIGSETSRAFDDCFGKNSNYIKDAGQVVKIANTMNKRLLENTKL